jgi:arylsulfatase A-like enzyme
VVRLDRVLGELLDYLEQRVGKGALVVALSADHGVAPMPERQHRLGLPGTRESAAHIACVQAVTRALDATYGHRDWFADRLYFDPVAVAASQVPRADLDRVVVRALGACPDVAHVWTRAQMLPDAPTRNRALALYRNSFYPARSADFALQWQPFFVERTTGTQHKSIYEYDTHVPLVLRVPGVAPRTIDRPVATVDMAATLAALLGLRPSTRLDGHDLSGLFLPPPPPTAPAVRR